MQQQRDRAERQWLQTKATDTAIHRVELQQSAESSPGDLSLLNARSASTQLSGHLNSSAITELSGLAPILGSEKTYWAINDSGNRSELFATTEQGVLIATIGLSVPNRDWEDLATFKASGKNWLVVADTGDNLQRRATSSLYFFQQPDLAQLPQNLEQHHRIDFKYEDGPKNVESMAVSASGKTVFLIAKESGSAAVYSLPLVLDKPSGILTAKRSGELHELFTTEDTKWWERKFAKRLLLAPTALDISADGRLAVVANYRHAYLFRRAAGEGWGSAFSRRPQVLLTHRMEQSESIAFSSDSRRVIISSEGLHAPVLVVSPGVSPTESAAR